MTGALGQVVHEVPLDRPGAPLIGGRVKSGSHPPRRAGPRPRVGPRAATGSFCEPSGWAAKAGGQWTTAVGPWTVTGSGEIGLEHQGQHREGKTSTCGGQR